MSVKDVDNAFLAGKTAAEMENGMDSCPHAEGTFMRQWWTRGFSYQDRLLRAQVAEKEIERLRQDLKHIEDSFTPDQWTPLSYVKDGAEAGRMAYYALKDSEERMKKSGMR